MGKQEELDQVGDSGSDHFGHELPGTSSPRGTLSSTVMKASIILDMAKYADDQPRDEHGMFSAGGQTPVEHAPVLKNSGYKFQQVKQGIAGKEDIWVHPNGNTVSVMRSGRSMIQGPRIASGHVSTDLPGLKA